MRRRLPLIYIQRPYSKTEYIVARGGRWLGVIEKRLSGWVICGQQTRYQTKEDAGQKLAATRGAVYR